MDIAATLREQLAAVRPYPQGMLEIPALDVGPIRGRSFFPGGTGRANNSDSDGARPDLLVVGNDFGRYDEDYAAAVKRGYELEAGTWSGILKLLRDAKVATKRCFFTNAVMGARSSKENTGKSPAMKERGFVARCAEFLRLQVSVVQPIGIIMIGKNQASVVSAAFPELAQLGRCKSWREIDESGIQFYDGLRVSECAPIRFGAFMHPSHRAGNMAQHGRRFRDFKDDAAEIEMLRLLSCGR